jgi:type IV secretion system protein VirD4
MQIQQHQQRKKLKQKPQQPIKKAITGEASQPVKQIIVPAPKPQTAQPSGIDAGINAINKNSDWFIFGAVILFVLIIVLKKLQLFKRSKNTGDQHGTARFATANDINELTLQHQDGNIKVGKIKDWKILTRLVNLDRDTANKHTVIIGPNGSGKSRSFFLPNAAAAGRSSFVCTDPKSEIYSLTAKNKTGDGSQRNPRRYAPTDPNNSVCFNFVAYCTEVETAETIAAALVHSAGGTPNPAHAHWTNGEEAVMTALLLHTAHTDVPTPTHLYEIVSKGVDTVCDILSNSTQPNAARLIANFTAEKDEKFQSSVINGLNNKLKFLENPAIRQFTSSSTEAFDFGILRDKPIQVFWCLRQDEVAKLRALTVIFFATVIRQLLRKETGKIPVTFFLDEFANIGRIDSFEFHIAVLRGQKIGIAAGLQSTAQLQMVYGPAAAEVILDNFNNKLLLSGLYGESVERLSRALGDFTYIAKTESRSSKGGWTESRATVSSGQKEHKRALLTPDELRRLPKNKIILISEHRRPVMMNRLKFSDPLPQLDENGKHLTPKMNRCGAELPIPHYEIIVKDKDGKENTPATLAACVAASTRARAEQPKQATEPEAVEAETVITARSGKLIPRVEQLDAPNFTVADLHEAEPEMEILDYDSIHEELEAA